MEMLELCPLTVKRSDRLIGRHIKSVNNTVSSKGDRCAADCFGRQPELVAGVVTSRIKLAAEATDLRNYIGGRVLSEPDVGIIVVGDPNDGPGAADFRASSGGSKLERHVLHCVAARRPPSARASDHLAVSLVFGRRAASRD